MTGRVAHLILSGVLVAFVAGQCFGAPRRLGDDRYKLIVTREPFGSEPIVDNTPAPGFAEEQASRDLRLCMLLDAKGGKDARAGLVDKKLGKSFILSVGETAKGVRLLEIDIENSNATLERNGVTLLLKLSKGQSAAVARAPGAPTGAAATPRRSVRRRRVVRRPQPVQPQQPVPQPTPEERAQIRRDLEDYQMEVIRQGMPPLPIPLTDEMDAQLVAEGVLPPSE